jgi:hypothetical protein
MTFLILNKIRNGFYIYRLEQNNSKLYIEFTNSIEPR